MSTIIIRSCAFSSSGDKDKTTPLDAQDIHVHIGRCLLMIPPKFLSRFLRDAFMIQIEELEGICPQFGKFATELAVLMIRLDAMGEESDHKNENDGKSKT